MYIHIVYDIWYYTYIYTMEYSWDLYEIFRWKLQCKWKYWNTWQIRTAYFGHYSRVLVCGSTIYDMGHVDVGQFCECSFKVCTWGKFIILAVVSGIFLSSDNHSCISCHIVQKLCTCQNGLELSGETPFFFHHQTNDWKHMIQLPSGKLT